jgi:hypothetical protein
MERAQGRGTHTARVTKIDYRYEVGDDCCGLVECHRRKFNAIEQACTHRKQHGTDSSFGEIRVTDTMHRHGKRATVFAITANAEVRSSPFWE